MIKIYVAVEKRNMCTQTLYRGLFTATSRPNIIIFTKNSCLCCIIRDKLHHLSKFQMLITKKTLQAEEERINKEKQLEQEERIAKELARINFEKQREEKMRQYIRENRYD